MSMNPEDSLLRVLLLDNAQFWNVCQSVCPEDFSPKARRIYSAIADAVRAGQPCDSLTIAVDHGDALGREAGDITANAVGVVANVQTYARLVRERGESKRLKDAGARIGQAESYEAAQAILAGVRPQQSARMKSVKDGLGEMVEALQRRFSADGEVSGTPTGLASLDELTSGWQPGNLIIAAARPGMGKSVFGLQAAMASGRSLYASLEMTAGELMERAVANVGQLPHRWMRFPKDAPEHAMTQITAASREVSALPLLLDDSPSLAVDAICSRVRQAHMADPLRLVVVDHLGLIARDGKHDASELGAITSQLKRLAKEINAPVLLLCQLNRGLETRTDKRPVLSDLRDSGRIEEDADVVLALYRDEYYNPASPLAGYLEIIIRKNRSGEQGTAWAKSVLSQMRLESCDEPERPAGNVAANDGQRGFASRFGARTQPARVSGAGRYDG